jgi:hypothetical protein
MTDHDQFALDVARPRQTVILLALAEGGAVNVGGKVADRRLDACIEGASIRQMSAEAHTRGAHTAIAGRQRQQVVHRQGGILIVRRDFLQTVRFREMAIGIVQTLLIFHRLPLSVSSASYFKGAGPVNS